MKPWKKCPGYDGDGKRFDCDGTPGTPWTPVWCRPCDERRRARLTQQFAELQRQIRERSA